MGWLKRSNDWGERMCKELRGMVHNSGSHESVTMKVTLSRPGKEFDHYDGPRSHCAVTSSKWDSRTAMVFTTLQIVLIVWVKLRRRCRVVPYSNTPCSRLRRYVIVGIS
uniref:Uncharacterized protein n=1 Tax=Oryza rufipogon TaxID=4529 RepID=A0A0E0Q6Z9_ORYRU